MLETQSWPCNKCSKEFKKDKKNGKKVNFPAENDPFGAKLDFSKESFSVEFFPNRHSDHFPVTKELQKIKLENFLPEMYRNGFLELFSGLINSCYCVPT